MVFLIKEASRRKKTRADICEALGCSMPTLKRWESVDSIPAGKFFLLAEFVGYRVELLLDSDKVWEVV